MLIEPRFLTREQVRSIKKMDASSMNHWAITVYRQGFEDGCESVSEKLKKRLKETEPCPGEEEVQIEWEDILSEISKVKGVGPKMLNAINAHLTSTFVGDSDGEG